MSNIRFMLIAVTAVIGAFSHSTVSPVPDAGWTSSASGPLILGALQLRMGGRHCSRGTWTACGQMLKKAKEEGNEARVKEIERIGPTSQVIMHQQGFSTGSVGNIMDQIKDKLPMIAQKKNVRLVVSKWEVFHHDGPVELVDITDELVSLFAPDAQTLKIIEEVKKDQPRPDGAAFHGPEGLGPGTRIRIGNRAPEQGSQRTIQSLEADYLCGTQPRQDAGRHVAAELNRQWLSPPRCPCRRSAP